MWLHKFGEELAVRTKSLTKKRTNLCTLSTRKKMHWNGMIRAYLLQRWWRKLDIQKHVSLYLWKNKRKMSKSTPFIRWSKTGNPHTMFYTWWESKNLYPRRQNIADLQSINGEGTMSIKELYHRWRSKIISNAKKSS